MEYEKLTFEEWKERKEFEHELNMKRIALENQGKVEVEETRGIWEVQKTTIESTAREIVAGITVGGTILLVTAWIIGEATGISIATPFKCIGKLIRM